MSAYLEHDSNDRHPPKNVVRLDAIMPARNEEGNVAQAVRSLRRAMLEADVEGSIVVVDDCSSDNTGVRALDAGALVVRSDDQVGPREAWRLGLSVASSDWIILMDSDCTVEEYGLVGVLPHLDDCGIGLIAGEGRLVHKGHETRLIGQSVYFSSRLVTAVKRRLSNHDFLPIGKLMVVRREVVASTPSIGPCDRAIARDAKDLGLCIRYDSNLVVYYTGPRDYQELLSDYRRTVVAPPSVERAFDPLPFGVLVLSLIHSIWKSPYRAMVWIGLRVLLYCDARILRRRVPDTTLKHWDPLRGL